MTERKVAVVTGAAQGIGEGIAMQLARDGFDIVIGDLERQREKSQGVIAAIEEIGQRAIFQAVDVSDRDSMFALVDAAVAEFGTLDALVNNAGICDVVPIADVTPEQLERIYRINVFSVVYGIQAAAAKFEELGKEKGRIVCASSIAGFEGFPILSAYSGTKFAVRGILQASAQELAPKHITVNGYAPGIVATLMWDHIDAEMSKLNGKPKGQNMADMLDSIALHRFEYPQDVAGVVSFLVSDKADYVTGQTVIVDGGMQFR